METWAGPGTLAQVRQEQLQAWYFSRRGLLAIPIYAPLGLVFWNEWTAPLLTWGGGAGLVVLGCVLRLVSVRYLGRHVRSRQVVARRLVTAGPYAWTRNPVYIATLLMAAGFGLLSHLIWYLPLMLGLLALHYSLVVRCEEARLMGLYQVEYKSYMARVPRWMPRRPKDPGWGGPYPWSYVFQREWRILLGLFVASGALLLRGLLRSWIQG